MKHWLRRALLVTAALLTIGIATAIFMRNVGDDPARWHVDPLSAVRTGQPNDYLIAPAGIMTVHPDSITPVFAADPTTLMATLDRLIMSEPRTKRIAGRPEDRFVTYVQRSRIFGFPDYVSVRAFPKMRDL